MKKRIISLLLASAMLLSMTSCSKKEQNLDVENMTLEEYIDKVKLPKNLTISIDPATVEERETVKVYDNVKYMEFDDEAMKKIFLRNPVTQEYESGDVWHIETETDTQFEALNLSNTHFNYAFARDKTLDSWLWELTNTGSAKLYTYGGGKYISSFDGTYASADKELDFSSRKEIAKQVEDLFTQIGISVETEEIVAYDVDTLQTIVDRERRLHKAYYQELQEEAAAGDTMSAELLAEMSEETGLPNPQKEDEHYWVFYRQLIDEIPLNTYAVKYPEDGSWAQLDSCFIQYLQDGMAFCSAVGLVESPIEEDGIETKILSAAEALELAKQYYGQGVLLKSHDIESMELLYIEYSNDDGNTVSLKPYWLIKTSYQQAYDDPEKYTDWEGNPLEGEVKAYDYTYFDAVTGEYFEGSTSAKPYD